jgi:hypothetical protein
MTTTQYTEAIESLNDKLKPSRSSVVDGALLATGPLLVPLIPWAVRHRNQTRRRKRLLAQGIHEFNMQYQELLMRWNRQPESTLTIERRHVELSPDAEYRGPTEEAAMLAQATLVSDVVAPVSVIPTAAPPASQDRQAQYEQSATRPPSSGSQQYRQSSNDSYAAASGLV